MTDTQEALARIAHGAVDLLPEGELRERLESIRQAGRVLRVKLGMDPTAPDLHLGHTVLLHKARQFQDLGHRVLFVVGDFTAMIGDPTGKNVIKILKAQKLILLIPLALLHVTGHPILRLHSLPTARQPVELRG